MSELGGNVASADDVAEMRAERKDPPRPPLVVVDAANVVGSVPDGWWRDRVGATERLRDALEPVATQGLRADSSRQGIPPWATRPPLEVVLVVEGEARHISPTEHVRVVAAPGSGDDAIVDVVRTLGVGRPCLVITADRQLRSRVTAFGAHVVGPLAVRPTTTGRT
jgi:hypothetical protein